MRRPAAVLLTVILLLPLVGAAPSVTLEWHDPPVKRMQTGDFEGNLKELRIGEIGLVNATIRNDLPVEDNIMVTFRGEALGYDGSIRLLKPDFPDELPNVNCDNTDDRCRVTVPADSAQSFDVTVKGVAVGSSPMTANASSVTTGLSSQDTLQVQVGAFFERTTVAAPGITLLQVAVLGVLGAFTFILRR